VLARRALGRAALGAAVLSAASARAQKSADTLRITWRDAVADLDPYRNQLRTGLVIAHHVWDCLLDRDPATLQLRPLLASAWRQQDDTTLRFTLRDDVVFHDGSPLSPEDVVDTVATVLRGEGIAVPSLYGWLAGAEQSGPSDVLIRLHEPFPAAPEYIAMALPILPRGVRPGTGAPVGTGPYRIAAPSQAPGADTIQLERFDGYFANNPKGRPAIARLLIRQVADAAEEFADLLSDRADWIWQLSADRLAALAQSATLQSTVAESLRVTYLAIDAAGRSGVAPLTDMRVRRAICHAIDRDALAARLGIIAPRVPLAPCYPTQFGCDGRAAVRYRFDPDRARALLSEAGYAEGFAVDLVSYTDATDGAAVRADLQRVGITARLVQLPTETALARDAAGQAPLFLGSWGSYSLNDVAAFLPHFFGGGPFDAARRPALQEALAKAGRSGDPDRRRLLYAKAIQMLTEQALFLPLHTTATTYAFTRALDFRPAPDELPRFYTARWR
jgi:peptide/nickel transport system substrate-binding protein